MDFQGKSRFVTVVHTTEVPNSTTYSRVVYHDSICIVLPLAYLNDVDTTAIDMDNAYPNAPCAEKIWFIGGDEYVEDKIRFLLIVRALYGIISAGLLWISSLAAA